MTTLDIILPAYNPLPGWEDIVISRFTSLVQRLPTLELHLIIVNDGSTKPINEEVALEKIKSKIKNFQWISYTGNKGKGYALRKGVATSTSEHIIYTDIDWPYTEESVLSVIEELHLHDVVVGIRDSKYYLQLPPGRSRISRLLKEFNSRFLKLKVADTQAGLKGFTKNVKSLFLSTTINRYLFDLEFIYLVSKSDNLTIKSVPISLREGMTFSTMNRKILFREARNFFKIWLKR